MATGPYISPPGSNLKLGQMWSWNLPNWKTCPGRTEWCSKFCYGDRGRMGMTKKAAEKEGTVEEQSAYRNWQFSRSKDFVPYMISDLREIAKNNDNPVMRIHSTGDFYSPEYVRKWADIISNLPQWKFYVYTRTWQNKLKDNVNHNEMMRELENLRNVKTKNVAVLASTDPYTGPPPAGWKESGVGGMWTNEKTICTVLGKDIGMQSKYDTCRQCGRCADPNQGGVVLPVHSLDPDDIPKVVEVEKYGIAHGWKKAPIPWVLAGRYKDKTITPSRVPEFVAKAKAKAAKVTHAGIKRS